VGALCRQVQTALERFEGFFFHPDLQWVELTAAVVEQATLLRADYYLRTPDALQAACCQQLGSCSLMVAGDGAFQRASGLPVALEQGGGLGASAAQV
jgi:predicted nucleic acid-binding protein